jgi:hypothetical protein
MLRALPLLVLLSLVAAGAYAESLAGIGARVGAEAAEAYKASPFAVLSQDYFARFSRDPQAQPTAGELGITQSWQIVAPEGASPVVAVMAGYLDDFLARRMNVDLNVASQPGENVPAIVLLESGGGNDVAESFTITVAPTRIEVRGKDPAGLRDGVVRLVDRIGFREAPFLKIGDETRAPRLKVRQGSIPHMGSYRELVFLGHNAATIGGDSLFAYSRSEAIPELKARQAPGSLEQIPASAAEARKHALKTYVWLNTRQKFPGDDPVFQAHPEIRGALTWKADGEYVLCTEHPRVQQWLRESVRGIFETDPALDGVVVIIGGEGFYHCYMRPFGVEKGHTNCERCEALGAETVVANLCNLMAEEARAVNPAAEVLVWPYSAAHVWSVDPDQLPLLEKLKPGVALLTEIEKDEYLSKPDGVRKHLWDYSIDMIGPGERAKRQIEACRKAGISVYLKSEPELGFEAPRLPHIPCMDRWLDRADALASSGATGAFVFPAFRPNYGTSAAELAKHAWWDPIEDKEAVLEKLAARLFGNEAGPHVRVAWRYVSEAIPWSPELPPYYTGPYYLGPAHPMIANQEAEVPEVFYGYYLFMAEITDAEGTKVRPTFMTSPRGNVPVFLKYYREMERLLKKAVDELDQVQTVDDRHKVMFDAEASSIRWFYHTARAHANFYESCTLRDALLGSNIPPAPFKGGEDGSASVPASKELQTKYERWKAVLTDELANARAALPLAEADVRLDWYYGGDHTFPHAADMLRAKIAMTEHEINQFLPGVARDLGIETE